MENEKEIKSVFEGSLVEARLIKEILEEDGIGVMIKNTLSEGHLKKWMSGFPHNSYMVYVENEHLEKAQELINSYFKSTDQNENRTY